MINNVSKEIITRFGVNKFIETGVFMGDTMMIVQDWFCELFGSEFNTGPWNQGVRGKYRMYEIESNTEYVGKYITPRHQNQINVEVVNEDSVQWLNRAIANNEFTSADSCFFYLDAHSHGSSNPEPLCDEIIAIKKLGNTPIISIDDWFVPGKNPDVYDLQMIHHLIKDRTDVVFYSDNHNFHGKWSIFIFLDRYEANFDFDTILFGLPLIKQKI